LFKIEETCFHGLPVLLVAAYFTSKAKKLAQYSTETGARLRHKYHVAGERQNCEGAPRETRPKPP
jgi:hypothetical protein